MPGQIAGVAGEIARMSGLHGLDGKHTSATTHAGRGNAQILGDLLAIQRPVDVQGRSPPGTEQWSVRY